MNDPYLAFDGLAPWGNAIVPLGYELNVYAGGAGWLPHIEITPRTEGVTYHFVRHFHEVGVYTPAYAIPDPACGVYSLPYDLPVPTWMPVAIERAGFGYDPTPNSERRTVALRAKPLHPDQTELVVA